MSSTLSISNQPLLLGVDGGGTSCRARITDLDGTVLGEGCAGSANPRVGLDAACNAILQATGEAMAIAGLGDDDFARIYAGLGLAGVNQKKERNLVLGWGFRLLIFFWKRMPTRPVWGHSMARMGLF